MRRSRKQRPVAPATKSDASSVLLLEDLDALRPGDVVMLPDGALAAVEKIVGRDAHVVEWQKQVGRGPWIFPVAELVLVS